MMNEEINASELPTDGSVALIDGDSLLYYEMGKPTLEEAIEGLDMRIRQILNFAEVDCYAGFLTLSKCFRYNIAKTRPYKYNRKGGAPKPPIFYALKEYIQQEWGFYGIKELEADDLVAIFQAENTVICSPDKDVLKQLIGTHFNYGKQEYVTTTEAQSHKFLLTQILMGDSTDGIPGIPKVGEKTAGKWVEENPKLSMVLEKYQEKFGIQEGIHKFAETFNLVYLLRTSEEAQLYVDESDLILNMNNWVEEIEEDDSDW
mgnify:CR=1 FL=1